jgi:hypothetical protein
MKHFWLESSLSLSGRKADFYSGARKILSPVKLVYDGPLFAGFKLTSSDITLADSGFTNNKLQMLRKNYYLAPSVVAAKKLWKERVEKNKYGSVGVSCYGHYVKGDVGGHTPRGSKFGPCIQAICLTYNKRRTTVDVFYRTTELFKKFPADLVFLRDVLLAEFDFKRAPIERVNFHFANVTCHPMYWITLVPHLENPVAELEKIRKRDSFFWKWIVKWSARYICDEYSNGIQKFAQALRVGTIAHRDIEKNTLKQLQAYLRKNHPGKNDIEEEEDDD